MHQNAHAGVSIYDRPHFRVTSRGKIERRESEYEMSRGRSRKRLANVLPAAVVVFGAGLSAARKLRADRRARRQSADRVAADPQIPEPRLPASSAASESTLVLVETEYEISPHEEPETSAILAVSTVTATEDATGEKSAPASDEPPPAPTAPAAGRAPRGATTNKVLEALGKGGTMTAAEVAMATGIGRATISSTLSRLTRSGQVTKAERGYQLPSHGSNSGAAAEPAAPKRGAPRAKSTKAPSTASARAASLGTKAKVLAALSKDGGLTASEVATATGLGRGTVSTTLSRLAKNGEVIKADRGYRLPA